MKNNKICLILPCNLYVIPYFNVYEDMLEKANLDYDLILWNRSLIKENCNGEIISYDKKDVANDKNPKKVFKYLGFYRFVKQTIKKNEYNKIVFLDTSACTVVLLAGFMRKKFKNRYWIDIRDYSFENIAIYKKLLKKAIDSAYCVDISSRGFLDFLPTLDNYYVTHNIDFETIKKVKKLPHVKSSEIRISFIGNVRYYELNKKLLLAFKNDPRFCVQFFGTGSEVLEEFCLENNIKNVKFKGRFPYEDTPYLYQITDIINNVYGNTTMEVTTALSNKLYYSIYLDKPILVSSNTYMSKFVTHYNLGYEIDYNNVNLADDLYDWYLSFKEKDSSKRNQAISYVEKDFDDYQKRFNNFLVGDYNVNK